MRPMRKIIGRWLLAVVLAAAVTGAAAYADGDREVGVLEKNLYAFQEKTVYTAGMSLGFVAADAARSALDADVAILFAGDFAANLRAGTVTGSDVAAVFPTDRELAVAELSVPQFMAILEQGISAITIDMKTESIDRERSQNALFPQISGFEFVYDASGAPGERVISVELDDGRELEDGITLKAAVPLYVFEEGLLPGQYSYEASGRTLRECFSEYIAQNGENLNLPKDGSILVDSSRIRTIGSTDSTFAAVIPRGTLIVIAFLLLGLGGVIKNGNRKKSDIRENADYFGT